MNGYIFKEEPQFLTIVTAQPQPQPQPQLQHDLKLGETVRHTKRPPPPQTQTT